MILIFIFKIPRGNFPVKKIFGNFLPRGERWPISDNLASFREKMKNDLWMSSHTDIMAAYLGCSLEMEGLIREA